jgi:hypothetical protein
VRKPGAHGLDDGLLGGEARRQVAPGPLGALELRALGQNSKRRTKSSPKAVSAPEGDIDADKSSARTLHLRAFCTAAAGPQTPPGR